MTCCAGRCLAHKHQLASMLIEAEGAAEAGNLGTEIAARSPLELFWRRFRATGWRWPRSASSLR